MVVVRMITRSKWEPKSEELVGEIPADAVTGDLRTQGNSLSFWRSPSGTERDFEDVVLAIAAGRDKVDKVEIVWLEKDDLKNDGLTLVQTDGCTPIRSLTKLHADVPRLDYTRLGKIAHRIASAIAANQYSRVTRARVKKLLLSAINGQRLDLETLNEKIQNELKRTLEVD